MARRNDSLVLFLSIMANSFFVCLAGCSQSHKESTTNSHRDRAASTESTKVTNSSPFHPLACEILENFPESVNKISGNSRAVLSGRDDCVQELIDSLTSQFIVSKKLQYIAALDSLTRVSDGYVSDYLGGTNYELFMKALPEYIHYLQSIEYDSRMRETLVYGLKAEVEIRKTKGESELHFTQRKDEKVAEVLAVVNSAQADLSPQGRKYVTDILKDGGVR